MKELAHLAMVRRRKKSFLGERVTKRVRGLAYGSDSK